MDGSCSSQVPKAIISTSRNENSWCFSPRQPTEEYQLGRNLHPIVPIIHNIVTISTFRFNYIQNALTYMVIS